MDQLLSPKQIAEAIGASESSVKRWCDQGLLTTVKTAGGHRRISVQEALRFAREQNHSVVEPRILAMPATDDRKARRIEGCAERLTEALLSDNELACHAIVFDLFVAGYAVSQIFDHVIAVAFRTIGDKWECHEADVYQERCSCQVMLRVLHEFRAKQVHPGNELKALGATIEGDQYSLPVTMAEIVLRSVGWDARLLGSSIPYDSMINAIQRHQPGLFWLSVSYIRDEAEFIAGFNRLFDAASKCQTAVVVGGRALTTEIRTKLRYTAFCDTMRHLEEFGKTLSRQAKPTPATPGKMNRNA
jgi:methanogenic corrinoid protein MtbC1